MNLDQIKPKEKGKSDKYSWQLYQYFKKNKYDMNNVRVIFDNESWFDGSYVEFNKGNLNIMQVWIGLVGEDGWLYGNRLRDILSSSRNRYDKWANPWIQQHEHVDITDWFWSEYIEKGRCTWNKYHCDWFVDDEQFHYVDENTRKCNWCGKVQHKGIKEEIRRIEVWE